MSINRQTSINLDSISRSMDGSYLTDCRKSEKTNQKPKSTLFSCGKRMDYFFTEDSNLYITPREYKMIKKGIKLNDQIGGWDSLSSRIVNNYAKSGVRRNSMLYRSLMRRCNSINEDILGQSKDFFGRFSTAKLWNASIVGAIIFGMLTMTMIYRYLGQGVSAKEAADNLVSPNEISRNADLQSDDPKVLGEEIVADDDNAEYIENFIKNLEEKEKDDLEDEIMDLVVGYPIEKMVPYIAEKDKIVAAFLIGIAKKESNWGKRVPVLKGQDCYNYWGYRGQRRRMGSGGHTCFNSRKDAVDTVAKRIEWLVNNKKLNTPAKMIVWKCGSTCKGHSSSGVRKWISDVNMYFQKLND